MSEAGVRTDWSTVQAGDIVLGKDRRAWAVMTKTPEGEVTLETDGKPPYTGTPSGEVVVLSSAAQEMEMAVAQTQVRLGGRLVAEQDDHGRYLVPVTFGDYGSLAAHLYLLHNVRITDPPGEQSLRGLLATHDMMHTPERKTEASGYVEHVHDPEFYAARGRTGGEES
jgi:hypothetical protein